MIVTPSLLRCHLRGQSLFRSNFKCPTEKKFLSFLRLNRSRFLTARYIYHPQKIILQHSIVVNCNRMPSLGGYEEQLVHPSASSTVNYLYLCLGLMRLPQLEMVWMQGMKNSIACIWAFFGQDYRRGHHLNLSVPAQLQIYARNAPRRSREWQIPNQSQVGSLFYTRASQGHLWWHQSCIDFLWGVPSYWMKVRRALQTLLQSERR